MTLKNYKMVGAILIFLLCFLFHFLYDWLPNPLFSLFFPVNESIWEHMKLLFTPFVVYTIVEYLFLRKYEKINNIYFQLFLIPIVGIIIYLLIFLPVYYKIGENMIFSIALLFVTICIEQFLSYKFCKSEEFKYQTTIGVFGCILTLFAFSYFTYLPLKQELFFDTQNEIYGIPENIKNTVYKR